MQTARTWSLALAACALIAASGAAMAQPAPDASQRNCQVLRTCQFARGGAYRGCLSSYSCRLCRFVAAPCFVDGARRVCQRVRCTWG